MAGAQMAIVNGIGYDAWASKLLAANPSSGRTVLDVGDLLGLEGRRQPAPVVLAGLGAEGDRPDHRRLQAGRSRPRRLLRAAASAASRPRACAEYDDLIAQIKVALRGHPGRRLGEHLRTAGAGARPEADHPDRASWTRSPRAPNRPPPTRRPPTARSPTTQIEVWVYNSQNATPDVQRLNDAAEGGRHPDRHRDRDADPGRRQLPGLDVARAGGAARRRCGRGRAARPR